MNQNKRKIIGSLLTVAIMSGTSLAATLSAFAAEPAKPIADIVQVNSPLISPIDLMLGESSVGFAIPQALLKERLVVTLNDTVLFETQNKKSQDAKIFVEKSSGKQFFALKEQVAMQDGDVLSVYLADSDMGETFDAEKATKITDRTYAKDEVDPSPGDQISDIALLVNQDSVSFTMPTEYKKDRIVATLNGEVLFETQNKQALDAQFFVNNDGEEKQFIVSKDELNLKHGDTIEIYKADGKMGDAFDASTATKITSATYEEEQAVVSPFLLLVNQDSVSFSMPTEYKKDRMVATLNGEVLFETKNKKAVGAQFFTDKSKEDTTFVLYKDELDLKNGDLIEIYKTDGKLGDAFDATTATKLESVEYVGTDVKDDDASSSSDSSSSPDSDTDTDTDGIDMNCAQNSIQIHFNGQYANQHILITINGKTKIEIKNSVSKDATLLETENSSKDFLIQKDDLLLNKDDKVEILIVMNGDENSSSASSTDDKDIYKVVDNKKVKIVVKNNVRIKNVVKNVTKNDNSTTNNNTTTNNSTTSAPYKQGGFSWFF